MGKESKEKERERREKRENREEKREKRRGRIQVENIEIHEKTNYHKKTEVEKMKQR